MIYPGGLMAFFVDRRTKSNPGLTVEANILGGWEAEKTRTLAQAVAVNHIVAMEVDTIQHAKNLLIQDLP